MVDDFMLRGWKISPCQAWRGRTGDEHNARSLKNRVLLLTLRSWFVHDWILSKTGWQAVDERMSSISFALYLLGS